MLSPPEGLPEDVIVTSLTSDWRLVVTSLTYRPVGFGSHHWEVVADDGVRHFLTVDDLGTKREREAEPDFAAYERLRAALATASALHASGGAFVVAPIPTKHNQPVVQLTRGYAAALYPYVEGESYSFGEFSSPEHRHSVLQLVVRVHRAPPAAYRHARSDDFGLPHRDVLESTLRPMEKARARGPYAERAADLVHENGEEIIRALAEYDAMVARAQDAVGRLVLTHGEPHAGNTMLTATGWRLIDWDTVLLAPPERDLWSLADGDDSVLAEYEASTGVTPRREMLELYSLRWDLADLAANLRQLRLPHSGSPDDEKAWDLLGVLIGRLSR